MSSRNDPNETMNGIRPSASAAFHAGGAANTGLASSTSSSWVAGAAASRSRSDRAGGAGGIAVGMKVTPPGTSTLPTSAFSALTASA